MSNHYRRIALILVFYGVTLVSSVGAAVPVSMTLGYDTDTLTDGIQNSHPHNLSSASSSNIHGTAGESDEVCKFCHTPHGGTAKGPLWNRGDPIGPNGDGTFPLYTGAAELKAIPEAQYNATVAADASLYPNGSSRLCLSCHDGVTAVGEVIVGGTLAALTMSAYGTIDLSSSHPISFVFNAAVEAALPPSFSRPSATDPVALDALERMQCTTCHDPHIDTNDGVYTLPMWRAYGSGATEAADYDNTCLSCHMTTPGAGVH
ncbi:MAG: hypothetical protein GXP51_11395 [Deltaproteobacteria bacterium]|nr:hypothetical protein [Deltaproteobacteria bacterium]